MKLYAVGLLPLYSKMRTEISHALQPWFADDPGAAGKAEAYAQCLKYLVRHDPQYGYYPEPAKSWYIYKADEEEVVMAAFESRDLQIEHIHRQRHLKGFIGSDKTKKEWVGKLDDKLTVGVQTLSQMAVKCS